MKFTSKEDAPLAAFLEEKALAQKKQWTEEFAEQERQRLNAEAKAVVEAQELAEMNARIERLALTQSRQYVSPRDTEEVCSCGESVPIGSASHNTKQGHMHVRNPRLAVQYGRITREVFNDLSDVEKANGFTIEGIGLTTGVKETKTDLAHNPANALANNVIDPALRQRQS